MKLSITGTHRVGKTTLAERLSENLTEYEIKQEPFYELQESGVMFSAIPTLDEYIEQLKYSIKKTYTDQDNLIFDRSPIDLLAYVYALDKTKNIQTLYSEVQNAIEQIDILIFIPVETPDLIKCAESDLPSLRLQVNDILKEWIWDFNIEIIEVKGTLNNRTEQVLNRINNKVK